MAQPLPPGWEERLHNGRPYYLNHATQTTTVSPLALFMFTCAAPSSAYARLLRVRSGSAQWRRQPRHCTTVGLHPHRHHPLQAT